MIQKKSYRYNVHFILICGSQRETPCTDTIDFALFFIKYFDNRTHGISDILAILRVIHSSIDLCFSCNCQSLRRYFIHEVY